MHIGKAAAAAKVADRRSGTKPDAVNTWLIFGFTEGADVGAKGEWTISQDSIIRAGRRAPGYAAWDGATGIGYSLTERGVVAFAATTSFERNAGDLGPSGAGLTDSRGLGALGSFKYQFLRRNESPVGLAVQVSPYLQRVESPAIAHDTLGTEFRLIVDRALVPAQWFAAANLVYLPQGNVYRDGTIVREATVEISGAVSHRLWGDVFFGGEIRYLGKYQGYGVDQLAGRALYLGPTLFTAIGEQGYFGATWSLQVAGSSTISAAPQFDLENFERHQFRLKAGISF